MKIGLTLGKYAPFHKGHQDLINNALHEVDKLIVVIYDSPSVINIPLPERSDWIRKLYPKKVEVIEAWGASEEVGDTEKIKNEHEKYLGKLLNGRKIHAFYNCEFYGEHISKYLRCINRYFEKQIDISATKIRSNPFLYRNFLEPYVYQSFIKKIVFLGGPSTGKSTISELLARKYKTNFAIEYGREYWFKKQKNHRLSMNDLETIANKHIENEDKEVSSSNKLLFVDTSPLTTYIYAKYYFGYVSKKLEKLFIRSINRYDKYILCNNDFPFEDTWDRSGPNSRELLQRMTKEELRYRKIEYIVISGSIEQRLRQMKKIISALDVK